MPTSFLVFLIFNYGNRADVLTAHHLRHFVHLSSGRQQLGFFVMISLHVFINSSSWKMDPGIFLHHYVMGGSFKKLPPKSTIPFKELKSIRVDLER